MTWPSDRAVARLRVAAGWPAFEDTRYAVVDEIGRGGMGAVYLARDEALGRDVAIKVSNAVASSDLHARLRREAQILARLEHPGIVPIHDVGRLADGRLFYVMKRVRGRTLLAHFGADADLGEKLRVFERVCEPVAFAHAQGFVHRDLKPENVMVGPFGEVLVLDWGVAKLLEGSAGDAPTAAGLPGACDAWETAETRTQAGTIVGTRGFMAPEQALGEGHVDERADVYGLGAILCTLLMGEAPPPPAADAPGTTATWFDRHRAVPAALRAICARALARDPADRYPSASALAADIARWRAGDPVEAYPEPWYERAARVARKYRGAIYLILAYLVMRAIVALLIRG